MPLEVAGRPSETPGRRGPGGESEGTCSVRPVCHVPGRNAKVRGVGRLRDPKAIPNTTMTADVEDVVVRVLVLTEIRRRLMATPWLLNCPVYLAGPRNLNF